MADNSVNEAFEVGEVVGVQTRSKNIRVKITRRWTKTARATVAQSRSKMASIPSPVK
jgi:hypothetical protein